MVVNRGHQEDALAGQLVITDLDHDRGGLDHEQAADDAQHQFMLGGHGHRTQGTAQGQRASVAHEDLGWRRVVPEEPHAPADDGGAEDGQLTRAGHEVDLQVLGKDEVADQVADDAKGSRCHHDRHDSQAIQTVSQVHGIGEAHNGEGGKGHIEPADVQQDRLQEGEGDRGFQPRRGRRLGHPQDRQHTGDDRDKGLGQQFLFGRQARRGLLGHLGVVVDEAQDTKGRRHARDDPDIGIGQVPPQQHSHGDAGQDHQSTHGRGADLGQMGHRAIVTDRLSLALARAHPVDEAAAHGHRHDHGRRHGQGHAHGLILDQVQQRIILRHVCEIEIEQIEHQTAFP